MDLPTFATITGILVLLIGIPLLVAGSATAAFIMQLMRNTIFMRIMGAVIVVVTVLVLEKNYTVAMNARGLIRLVAWIGLIKGIIAAWFPNVLAGVSESAMRKISFLPVLGVVAIALGGLLLYGSRVV